MELIRENWLTRKPHSYAGAAAFCSILLLVIFSLLDWTQSSFFVATHASVFQEGKFWLLWSTLFVHADLAHLLSNGFFLGIFAYFLAGHFGWTLLLVAFSFGGITNAIVLSTMPARAELLGASGVVYWMGGAWLTLYFFLERRGSLAHRFIRSLGVAVILFVPETLRADVSYFSHFVGFCLGALFGTFYYLLKRKIFLAAEVRERIPEEAFTELSYEALSVPPEHHSTNLQEERSGT